MKGSGIRKEFLDYFSGKGHDVIRSSSLVPAKDPTLLFTNAGMVQFKDVFTGVEKRDYTRAASSQKCVRAGGKHNDLENVGRTARHHTFFEMLGNFSFGDYFKVEAIEFAWEFLTKVVGLPADRLWPTVFREDDEAAELWVKIAGVPAGRVVRLGEEDNFWAMGDTGPCGPCSEIIYDQGPGIGCGRPSCAVGCDCDRYLEIWNLVFMQYDRDASGKMTPLPKPSIDTGMGLERLTAVLQGKQNNFDTDLFAPLIAFVEETGGKKYGAAQKDDVSIRVIADHLRATTFLVGDGVLPSNEGRGYVLRRIMRRAARHGKMLGIADPFLHRGTEVVAGAMRDAYPDLQGHLEYIGKVTKVEEERFIHTLDQGMGLLEEMMDQAKKDGLDIDPRGGTLPSLRHLRLSPRPGRGDRRGRRPRPRQTRLRGGDGGAEDTGTGLLGRFRGEGRRGDLPGAAPAVPGDGLHGLPRGGVGSPGPGGYPGGKDDGEGYRRGQGGDPSRPHSLLRRIGWTDRRHR